MSETPMTARQLLTEVETAITKVLVSGQSYKIGSRSLTRADLKMLKSMRDDLQAQIAAESDTSLFSDTYVAFFDGR